MLNKIAGLLIITVSLLIAWFVMEFKQFANTPMKLSKEGVYYLLEPGTSLSGLARDLMDKGMVDSKLYFRLLARWQGSAAKIKAGEYHLQSGMTPNALLALLVSGSVTSYTLTLVEGWNFLQVLSAIRQQSALKQTLEGFSDDQVMQRLGHPDEHPEGRFLPDTYQFPRGTSDISFLNRAYKAMDQRLKKEWEKREKGVPLKTPYEALILASIVEKETAYPSERTQIAGVFTRRLRKEMKLQTDPTVIYGMGEAYDGNIRRRDLKRDTPYNTYVHKGLPPTPISMPGGDAIHAVMHPGKGKSLYFVAKSGGQHYFSNTLREHNNAVRKYQLKR